MTEGIKQVTIALAPSGAFLLTVPSVNGGGSHHVEIPATLAGISILKKMLAARSAKGDKRIGNVPSPTQFQVKQWLRADKEERARVKVAKGIKQLNSVFEGIDIGALDL